MNQRNPWSFGFGLFIMAIGIVWLVDDAIGFTVPWDWVVPAFIVAVGAYVAFVRSANPGPPISQFERPDAPRVP